MYHKLVRVVAAVGSFDRKLVMVAAAVESFDHKLVRENGMAVLLLMDISW